MLHRNAIFLGEGGIDILALELQPHHMFELWHQKVQCAVVVAFKPSLQSFCHESRSLGRHHRGKRANTQEILLLNEVIVNQILDDLVKACRPKQAVVRGKFASRGGIQLTCEAQFPDRKGALTWPAASLSTAS